MYNLHRHVISLIKAPRLNSSQNADSFLIRCVMVTIYKDARLISAIQHKIMKKFHSMKQQKNILSNQTITFFINNVQILKASINRNLAHKFDQPTTTMFTMYLFLLVEHQEIGTNC
ncbi:hypothetical protein CsSME_00021404 [Camellia sinensis var. sinensis]